MVMAATLPTKTKEGVLRNTGSSPSSVKKRTIDVANAATVRSGRKEEHQGEGSGDPMLSLGWYHPNLTRHAADCMLLDNAPEGSYLLRSSTNHDVDGSYVLSVKLSVSVQHIKITNTAGSLKFGNSTFDTLDGFRRHFEVEKPLIGSDSGITVVLNTPYLRFVDESHFYTDVVHHASTNMIDSTSESELENSDEEDRPNPGVTTQGVTSKEGYMVKQGRIRKNWKTRWFVLRGNLLSYFKTKQSVLPIDRLNLSKALNVDYDNSKQRQNCFSVEFSHRTYFFQASCPEDCQQWVEHLRSRLQT